MAPTRELAASGRWRKLMALALTLAAVGLPVNTLASYVPLLIAAVAIFSGEVNTHGCAWRTACWGADS